MSIRFVLITMFKLLFNKIALSLTLLLSVMTLSAQARESLNVGYAALVPDFYQSSELHAVQSSGWLELYLNQISAKSQHYNLIHFESPEQLKSALDIGEIDVAFSDPIYFQEQVYQASEFALSSHFVAVTVNPVANLKQALAKGMSIFEFKGVTDFDFSSRIAPHVASRIKPSFLLLQALKGITERDIYILPEILLPYLPNTIRQHLEQLSIKRLALSLPAKYAFIFPKGKQQARLASFNLAITSLTQHKHEALIQQAVDKVFFPALEHTDVEISKLNLTEEEQAWIHSTPIVKVASANTLVSSPFDIVDINNSYTGISADYLKLIGQLTGLKFVHTGSYSTLNMLFGYQEKSWDLFTTIPHQSTNSFQVFQLSNEYSYFSWNVITKLDRDIDSVSDLQKLTFAPLPYSASEKLKSDNPQMTYLATAKSAEDALNLVNSGAADFTILPSHSAPKLIATNGMNNLKLAYAFNSLKETIHFGVRNDLLILKGIIDKAISQISAEQHESIRNKWFGSNYTVELDWGKALEQSSPFLIAITCLVLALFAWSRKLRIEVKNRIKVQQQLEVANVQAEQATKAKSLFLSTMSHEIRTPMNGIIGMLELLSDSKLSAEQQRMLTTINSSSNSLMQIINDILDFSKIESDKLEIETIPFSLGLELESICDAMTKLALDKGVSLYLEIEPSLYSETNGDPTRFRQVITNLLSNAIKFTDHGQISIIAKFNEQIDDNKEIEVSVKDTGIGMSKKQLEKLFQPFTQAESSTTRRFGGTGLGLAITQQLCKLMSFKLAVVSEAGHGTAFTLSMPFSSVETNEDVELWQPTCLLINQNTSLNKLLEAHLTHWQIPYRKVGIELQLPTLIEMANNADHVLINIDDANRFNFPLEQFKAEINSPLINMTSQSVRASQSLSFNPLLPSQLKLQLTDADSVEQSNKLNDKMLTMTKLEAEEQGLLVLVAEDHPTNRLVLQKQLNTLGIHADFAEDGVQAWTNLQMKNYGLLLTDCHMPNMDGYTLAKKVRESGQFIEPELPVIALTASVLEADKKMCFEAGMNDVITKPATIEMLRATLSEWLNLDSSISQYNKPSTCNKETSSEPITTEEISQESLYDREFLEQMFGDSTNELLDEFCQALELDLNDLLSTELTNTTKLSGIAHRIKGAAESIMAQPLAQKAASLESIQIDEAIEKIEDKVSVLLSFSRQLINQIQHPE